MTQASASQTPIERQFTVAETAELLSSTPPTVLSYIHKGELVASKLGKSYLISASSIAQFLDRKRSR